MRRKAGDGQVRRGYDGIFRYRVCAIRWLIFALQYFGNLFTGGQNEGEGPRQVMF